MLNDGLVIFANWQTLLLGITIYVTTAIVRRVIETAWAGAKHNKWYHEVLLPVGPIANGVLLALLLKSFPWPAPIADSRSGRVMYALVCGLFCGWLYARVRGFFRQGQASGLDNGLNPSVSLPSIEEEKKEEAKPAEEKPAEEKPAEEKPAEEKPAEEKLVAEEKPAEERRVHDSRGRVIGQVKPSDAPVS